MSFFKSICHLIVRRKANMPTAMVEKKEAMQNMPDYLMF